MNSQCSTATHQGVLNSSNFIEKDISMGLLQLRTRRTFRQAFLMTAPAPAPVAFFGDGRFFGDGYYILGDGRFLLVTATVFLVTAAFLG